MEDSPSWSQLVLGWANGLKLAPPAKLLLDFTDGKFFAQLMTRYLPWNTTGQTKTETFKELKVGLKNEFPFSEVVDIDKVADGHEDEIIKVLTLLLYLASVKHLSEELSVSLQGLNKESQLRFKCVLQALMEQHSVLTPELLTTIMVSRVSDTTGHLTAPTPTARLADRPKTRVAKPSVVSPIIFINESPKGENNSKSNSPLKDFLDSPATRREAQNQRLMEQRNQQNRQLKTQLEAEKIEKQFAQEEVKFLQEDKQRLEQELMNTKQTMRERLAQMEKDQNQCAESDLQVKFHNMLDEMRNQTKYLESVERELVESKEERDRLTNKLSKMGEKLSETTDDKHRVEITLEDMRHHLTETREERDCLNENVADLQGQIEDLSMQVQLNSTYGSGLERRKSLAPSLASYHACDMTNISLDADDSVNGAGGLSPGETMQDVVNQQLEERIEKMEMERNRAEVDLVTEREIRVRVQNECVLAKEKKKEVENELLEERKSKVLTEARLDEEQQTVAYIKSELETEKQKSKKLDEKIVELEREKRSIISDADKQTNQFNSQLSQLSVKVENMSEAMEKLENDLVEQTQAKEILEKERNSLRDTQSQLGVEISQTKEKLSNTETRLDEVVTFKDSLEEKLKEELGKLESLQSEIVESRDCQTSISTELQLAKEELVKLESELDKKRQKQELADIKEGELTRQIEQFQLSEQELSNKITEVMKNLKQTELEKVDLEMEVKRHLEAAEKASTESRIELEAIKQEAAEMKSGLVEKDELSKQGKIREEQLLEQTKELQQELQQLQTKIELEYVSKEESRTRFKEKEVKVTELELELQSVRDCFTAESNKFKEEVTHLQEELKAAEEVKMQNSARVEELVSLQAEKEQELAKEALVRSEAETVLKAEWENVKHNLENDISSKMLVINEFKEKVNTHEKTIEELKEQLEVQKKDFMDRETKLNSATDQIKSLTSQRSQAELTLKSEVEELEKDVDSRINQLQTAGEQIGKLRADLAEVNNELSCQLDKCKEHSVEMDKTNGEFKEASATIKVLEAKITELDTQLIVSEEEKKTMAANILEIGQKLETNIVHSKNLNDNLETLKEEHEAMKSSSKAEIDGLKEDATKHAQELSEVKEMKASISEQNEMSLAVIAEKDAFINDIKSERDELKETLKLLQETKDAHDKSFEALKIRTASVSEENCSAVQKVALLEDNNSRLQDELDRALEQNKQIDETLIELAQKEQDLQMGRQRDRDTIDELGQTCDKRGAEIKKLQEERKELMDKITVMEKGMREGNDELSHKLDFLQSQLEEMETEKEELKNTKNLIESENRKLKENMDKMSEKIEQYKVEIENASEIKSTLTELHKDVELLKETKLKYEEKISSLEQELKDTMGAKDDLANSVSQLITDTNSLKSQVLQEQMNTKQKEEVCEEHKKKTEELSSLLQTKEAEISELQLKVEAGVDLENKVTILQKELATSEINLTKLEESLQGRNDDDTAKALAEQKERYDKRHKEVIAQQAEKWKTKMKDFCDIANAKVTDAEDKLKIQEDENKRLTSNNDKLKSLVEKGEESEKLNDKEKEMLEKRYNKLKEDAKIIHQKYEKLKEENNKLKSGLGGKNQDEILILEQELAKARTENKTLNHQLSFADTKLREMNKHGVDHRNCATLPRESYSSLPGGGSKLPRESLPSGRVTRQSTSALAGDATPVFKLPGAKKSHTPGRAKAGRTVSDTKMARSRPPTGSGTLFQQDEEIGEVFSSSYLSDLKAGHCNVGDDTGRMSELARRNTLAPAHLKSSYPIESQFCDDESITEDSIRNSRITRGRLTDLPADRSREIADVNSPVPSTESSGRQPRFANPSPVTRLSRATSDLSLDSPSTSTRGKRARSSISSQDSLPAKRVPRPTAFTVDAPKPGKVVRKGTKGRKPPLVPERGDVKQESEEDHIRTAHLESSPERNDRNADTDDPELDLSQEDASFSRDSLRSSKRTKANLSYVKPGPPTPGRNKSQADTSSDSIATNSTVSSTKTAPCSASGTPRASRASTKSLRTPLLDSTNTNTPGKNKSSTKFKKGFTPLQLKKAMCSAFRSKGNKTTYKLMKKQDEMIDRDQSKSKTVKTTPLKAKDKLGKSPRAVYK